MISSAPVIIVLTSASLSDERDRQELDYGFQRDLQHGIQAEPAQEHRGEPLQSQPYYPIHCTSWSP